MKRHTVSAERLLACVHAAVMSAQADAWRRRRDVLDGPALALPGDKPGAFDRARWMPSLAEVRIAFEGTTRLDGRVLGITPGRPWTWWFMRSRRRRIEVCCDARLGWAPRLYIDGISVDPTGKHPH